MDLELQRPYIPRSDMLDNYLRDPLLSSTVTPSLRGANNPGLARYCGAASGQERMAHSVIASEGSELSAAAKPLITADGTANGTANG